MGETRKLYFSPRILDERIVKDSLEAVSYIGERESLFLVGGVGIQSYLPTLCRRPTSDVDYAVARPLTYSDFKQIVKPAEEFLRDFDYSVEPKKASRSYMMIIQNKENSESLAVEVARHNEKSFQGKRKRLEKELENSKTKIIEGRTKSYRVACPEDLVVPKLVRTINSLKRNPFYSSLYKNLTFFSDKNVIRNLEMINSIREEAMINPGDLGLAERLRFISDLYDVRMMAEITGFNESSFYEAGNNWRTLREDSQEREEIFRVALPKLSRLSFQHQII